VGIGCLLAGFVSLVLYGACNAAQGQMIDVSGQWLGALPLEGGNDCRIKVLPTGYFDFECRGQTTYAAKGQWRRYGNTLEFDFEFFSRDGRAVAELPEPWRLQTDGVRNVLFVGLPSDQGEPYRWRRAFLIATG